MISDIFLLCYSREYLQKPNFCVVFGSLNATLVIPCKLALPKPKLHCYLVFCLTLYVCTCFTKK